uniref:Secreted protein n=1 Tax=Molossus molossus TaxID=27622 RepID=A0A7J8CZ25_MOLMO|nr:hypothetical protein HJG59_009452 [Molossus molossus]
MQRKIRMKPRLLLAKLLPLLGTSPVSSLSGWVAAKGRVENSALKRKPSATGLAVTRVTAQGYCLCVLTFLASPGVFKLRSDQNRDLGNLVNTHRPRPSLASTNQGLCVLEFPSDPATPQSVSTTHLGHSAWDRKAIHEPWPAGLSGWSSGSQPS